MQHAAITDAARAKELFLSALACPVTERAKFLDEACAGDVQLRNRVDELIDAHDAAGRFLNGISPSSVSPTESLSDVSESSGAFIGRYKLLQKIGEGGFGEVWMAEQTEPVIRRVALKIIKPGMDTRQIVARFEAERQALAMMDHPSIARVFDAGATEHGRPFFVMELVRGEPITRYCDRERLSVQKRLELFRDVCNAVQHAHQKGIIHRDLKPSNVLVTVADSQPLPKVIDFGIAKATAGRLTDKTLFTEHRALIGTPAYMSPEQADMSGADIDTRSDVYSLGVLLFELLTGTTPFASNRLRAAPFDEVLRIIREEDPPRPSIRFQTLVASSAQARLKTPPHHGDDAADSSAIEIAQRRRLEPSLLNRAIRGDLDWIVMKCLEKDRRRRYATASALADDISRHLEHLPVTASPPSTVYRMRKFVSRNRGAVLAGVVVAAALIIATGVSLVFGLSEARHRRAAETAADELERVARFQEEQLAGIDVKVMGLRLRSKMLDSVRSAAERAKLQPADIDTQLAELEVDVAGADFTGLALDALEGHVFTPALEAIESDFADQPLIQARLRQTLATTMLAVGLGDKALEPQEQALAVRREMLGDEHPDTLASIAEMGMLLRTVGRLSEAEPFYREVLDTRRRLLGQDDPETLAAINNLGRFLHAAGKLDEAEELMRQALEARRSLLGEEHIDTLYTHSNLAALLLEKGKLDEAEPLYIDALEKSRRVLGEDHSLTARVASNFGTYLYTRGRFAEAEIYFRLGLEYRRRTLGNEHPDTLSSIMNLGVLLKAQGRLEEAEPYYLEALESNRQVHGNAHPETLLAISNFVAFLQAQGRPTEAEAYARESLELHRRVLGQEHPNTLTMLNNLGTLLVGLNQVEEGTSLLLQALDLRRRVLGERHHSTLVSTHNMGTLLKSQGRPAEAEAYFREAFEKQRLVLGEEHVNTLICVGNLGSVLTIQGKSDEAVELLAPREPAVRRIFTGGNAVRLGQFLLSLGASQAGVGAFEDAEADLLDAHEILSSATGATSNDMATAFENLINLYDAWHAAEPDQGHDRSAAEWRAEQSEWQAATQPAEP